MRRSRIARREAWLALTLCVLALAAPAGAHAQGGTVDDPEAVGAFYPRRASLGAMQARGLVATGLAAIYPDDAKCPPITSHFGAQTRGDGSRRAPLFFQGYHGGIDIPVPEGTPVLAVADGIVVHKGDGVSIGGIGLILQHPPAATGLGVWSYTEYKHLKDLPPLDVGARVRKGEAIARSGKTGTQGPHYGPAGHPHLHLSAFYGESGAYQIRTVLVPAAGRWMDPLVLFRGPPVDSHALAALPRAAKQVRISYMTADGTAVPADARTVWPLACAAR